MLAKKIYCHIFISRLSAPTTQHQEGKLAEFHHMSTKSNLSTFLVESPPSNNLRLLGKIEDIEASS